MEARDPHRQAKQPELRLDPVREPPEQARLQVRGRGHPVREAGRIVHVQVQLPRQRAAGASRTISWKADQAGAVPFGKQDPDQRRRERLVQHHAKSISRGDATRWREYRVRVAPRQDRHYLTKEIKYHQIFMEMKIGDDFHNVDLMYCSLILSTSWITHP